MATAEAAVCNVALIRVGNTQLLEDLNGTDVVSKSCKALLAHNRDQLLQARPWPFATLRAALTVLADDSTDAEFRDGWLYVYTLPADCLAARYVYAGLENPGRDVAVPFKLEAARTISGRVLLTNEKNAELIYTARITEPPRWDPLFAEALAWKMAADLAFGIEKKPQLGEALLQAYVRAMAQASAQAGMQQEKLPNPVSEFESAR